MVQRKAILEPCHSSSFQKVPPWLLRSTVCFLSFQSRQSRWPPPGRLVQGRLQGTRRKSSAHAAPGSSERGRKEPPGIYAQAREYLPETGRFTGEDLIGGFMEDPVTINRYGYCWENPLRFVDLDGMAPTEKECKGGYYQHSRLRPDWESIYR